MQESEVECDGLESYDNCVGFDETTTLHQNIGRSTEAGCVGTVEALERVGLLSRKGATGLTIKIQ